MPVSSVYKHPRGTRASLNSLAGTSGLVIGQIYLITDENRIAVALTTSTYETYAKQSEGSSLAIDTVEVNFTTASPAKFFDVAVTGAATNQKVLASCSLVMPTGVQEDEFESDPIICSAKVLSAGIVRIFVGSTNGAPLIGKRNINLMRI